MDTKLRYRSVWVSDIHLGSKGCKVKYLDEFLSSIECDYLYAVGDIIDGWVMSRGATFFPQDHINILRRFLNKSRKGTLVKYIIGNHDEFMRRYLDFFEHVDFGNIEIGNEFTHVTADGKKLWVVHGDLYDGVTRYHKWISHLGDIGYQILITLNRHFNFIREKLGFPYWSLSAFIKHKVKQAVEFITSFEQTVARECEARKYDGVVCGHIHQAEIKQIGNVMYYNDGDWVESCTALVEHLDGRMEIIYWHKISHKQA